MRRTLIASSLALISSIGSSGSDPRTCPHRRQRHRQSPRLRVLAAAARPSILTIQVTDTLGAPLGDTQVTTTGPVAREGLTAADGSLRLANMRAGSYRVRFAREGSITLERERDDACR